MKFCWHRNSAATFKSCCHQPAYALSSIHHKCGCVTYFLQLRHLINSQDRDRLQLNYVEERERDYIYKVKNSITSPFPLSGENTRQHITQIMVTRSHSVFKVKVNTAEYSLSLSFSSISSSFKTYSSWHLSLYAAHIVQFKDTHTHTQNTKCFQIYDEGMLDETQEEKTTVRTGRRRRER